MQTTEEILRQIIHDYIGTPMQPITQETKIVEDLGADSLDMIEMLMEIEEQFGADISDEEAEKVKTFGDALKLVQSKL